jgi:hypothetical protein
MMRFYVSSVVLWLDLLDWSDRRGTILYLLLAIVSIDRQVCLAPLRLCPLRLASITLCVLVWQTKHIAKAAENACIQPAQAPQCT